MGGERHRAPAFGGQGEVGEHHHDCAPGERLPSPRQTTPAPRAGRQRRHH